MAGIKTDEVISVDDFPQHPNGLEHYGVRTQSNGLIDGQFIDPTKKENLTLGEDISLVGGVATPITVPQANSVIGDANKVNWDSGDSDSPYSSLSTTAWQMFNYIPDSTINALTSISLGNINGFSTNIILEVWTADGSHEPDTLIDTMTTTNTTTGNTTKLFESSSYPELTSGTEYLMILKATSGSGTSYINDAGSNTWTSRMSASTNSGTSWTHYTNNRQRVFIVTGATSILSIGKAYLADKDVDERSFISGFLLEGGLKDDVKEITTEGVVDGFSGLTLGNYYLASGGGITTTDDGLLNRMKATIATRIILEKGSIGSDNLLPVSVSSVLDSGVIAVDGFLFGTIGGSGVAVTLTVTTGGVTFTTVSTTTGKQGFCIPVKAGDSWDVTASAHAIYLRTQY